MMARTTTSRLLDNDEEAEGIQKVSIYLYPRTYFIESVPTWLKADSILTLGELVTLV